MITNKFGAIYCENENGEFELYDVFLVDYNENNNRFLITTGPAKKLNGDLFNLIDTKPASFLEDCSEVNFKDYDEEKDHIILFDDDFLDEIEEELELDDDLEAYTYIANRLSKILIHKNNDGSFFTKECEGKIEYTKESMHKLLFDKKNNIDPEEYERLISNELELDESPKNDEENDSFAILVGPIPGSNPAGLIMLTSAKYEPKRRLDYQVSEEMTKRIEDMKKKFEAEEAKKKKERKIDTRKIIESTSKKIVGQEPVIKTLVNQIYNNQMIIDDIEKDGDLDVTELDARKTSILLDGETGTGKTAILKDIAKQLGLPIVIASSTNFSATGYVGASVTDLLDDLLDQTDGDIEKAERGIIVFDEVDKLAFKKDSIIGKDMCEEVQHELLTFIGGGEYDVTTEGYPYSSTEVFNTSKNTIILSGAFTDLREEKIKEVDKSHKSMGFSMNSSDDYEKQYVVTPDDYIKYGLMREFFGRIKVLTSTKSYNLEDCINILTKSTISPLLNFEKTVKMYGYPGIEYDYDFINKVAEEGMKMKTGARGLQTVMSGIQNNLLDSLINGEFDKTKPIKLTISMIDDYKKAFVRKY